MKHFITTISQQPNLRSVVYKNVENMDFLRNEIPLTHPINIPIRNLAASGEKIRMTVLITDNPNEKVKATPHNLCAVLP